MPEEKGLKIVGKIGEESKFAASRKDLWHKLLDISGTELRCEAGSFFIVDESQKNVTLVQGFGDFAADIENLSFGYQGIVGWCAQNRQSIIVNDVQSDPRFCVKVDKATGFITKTVICIPVIDETNFYGILELINPAFYAGGKFSEEDRETLTKAAGICAAAARDLPETP